MINNTISSLGYLNYLNVISNGIVMLALIFAIALYLYIAFAWMTIAKKLKYKKPWLAFVPIANLFLIPILADKKWTWGFILIVPFVFRPFAYKLYLITGIVSIVFNVIWTWKIFEKRKYPGWLTLLLICGALVIEISPLFGILFIIAYLVVLGSVAWKDLK